MGKIVVSENVTLDGVIQDPSGDEGFERGGWVGKVTDREEAGKVLADETLDADAELTAGAPTNSWPRGGHHVAARWRTG